jgi:hypothetical protein
MKLESLHQKLIQAAKRDQPSDTVPYAFEQRIMARLADLPALDSWGHWASALWRASAPCVLIMVLCGAWTWSAAISSSSQPLANELEHAVYAAVDGTGESW